ncbi:MAG TPA: epimerase [Desulfobacteraceae bacterium]|nr:epimerase [Desulfobacteraceae bacterium]
MKSKSVLLLGGGGFLGSALAGHLCKQDYTVHILTRRAMDSDAPNITVHQGSLDDNAILEKILPTCSTVIHLASTTTPGSSANHPLIEAEQNIAPTLRFLQILQQYDGLQLIFVSSGGTLYGNPKTIPVSEDHGLYPRSYHGAGKAAIEAFLMAYSIRPAKHVTILRPSNLYGPGQTMRQGFGVIRTMLENLRNDTMTEIWGDGENIRDFLYISDMLAVFDIVLDHKDHTGIYNVGAGKGHSINQIRQVIEQVCGKAFKFRYLPVRDVDVRQVVLDCSRLKEQLGWQPQVSLEQGIRQTWEWVKSL